MKVLLNTDDKLSPNESKRHYFISFIKERLLRFRSHISRIEVYISDSNGTRNEGETIKCDLEAKVNEDELVTVSFRSETLKSALSGAIAKLKTSMDAHHGHFYSNEH